MQCTHLAIRKLHAVACPRLGSGEALELMTGLGLALALGRALGLGLSLELVTWCPLSGKHP